MPPGLRQAGRESYEWIAQRGEGPPRTEMEGRGASRAWLAGQQGMPSSSGCSSALRGLGHGRADHVVSPWPHDPATGCPHDPATWHVGERTEHARRAGCRIARAVTGLAHHVLGARRSSDGCRGAHAESMAVFLGERLSARLDARTLVVANLQRTVAVFSAGAAAAERAGAGAGHGDDGSHGEQEAMTPGDGLSCRCIDETMLRLKWSIQALAAPAAAQLRLFPDFVCVADELAIDFEEALRGIRSAGSSDAGDREEAEGPERAEALSPAQRAAVDALDAQLEEMSGPEHAEMWTDDALHTSVAWTRVRHLAASALRTMDWPNELPPQGRAMNVGPPDRGDDTT